MEAHHVTDQAVECRAVAHDIPYQIEKRMLYFDDAFIDFDGLLDLLDLD
jgi:hypothetical protein